MSDHHPEHALRLIVVAFIAFPYLGDISVAFRTHMSSLKLTLILGVKSPPCSATLQHLTRCSLVSLVVDYALSSARLLPLPH